MYRHLHFGENPGRSTSRGITFKPIMQTCLQINQISFKCCSVDGINLGEKYGVIFKRHSKVLKHKSVKKTPKTFCRFRPEENLASFICIFLLTNQATLTVYKHRNSKYNIRCLKFCDFGMLFFKKPVK